MKNNINFVLNIDPNYVLQSSVTITSIMVNLDKKCKANFYVFFKGFTTKPKEFKILEQTFNCSIYCIDTKQYDKIFAKLDMSYFVKYWKSLAPFYRLLMFKILPSSVDYAIYIDADAIVDDDLSKLYNSFKRSKYLLGAVADYWLLKVWFKYGNKKYYSKLSEFKKFAKNREKYPYFCNGFFIANIKKSKSFNVYEQMIDFLKKHPNVKQADQDVMNAIFSQKYPDLTLYLHPSYDVLMDWPSHGFTHKKLYYSKAEMKEAFAKPIVLHYAGANKPWSCNKVLWGVEPWWYYYGKTPCFNKRIKLPIDIGNK